MEDDPKNRFAPFGLNTMDIRMMPPGMYPPFTNEGQ